MKKKDIINEIKIELASRRHNAEVRAENFVEKLKSEDAEFKSLYLKYNVANLNLIKAKHSGTNCEEATKQFEESEKLLDEYLKSKGISRKRLLPQYSCKKCEDKGIFNGKMCDCLSEELSKRMSNENSTYNKFHTFKMINSNKMNENSSRIFKECYAWCESFPNVDKININLIGDVGTGKTFLLECCASKLLDAGKNVIFVTAFDFNEECRKYHFSQPNILNEIIECDCLIIDDLGTEPVLKNITVEYFYNVINLRQAKGKATLISTNLDFANLMNRYGERAFSRITNKMLALNYCFTGENKRLF